MDGELLPFKQSVLTEIFELMLLKDQVAIRVGPERRACLWLLKRKDNFFVIRKEHSLAFLYVIGRIDDHVVDDRAV